MTQPTRVQLSTSHGDILIELDSQHAPISTANFLSYVDKGAYDGTVFHRVISHFMIQGGGFDAKLGKRPTDKPIKNEWKNGLKNKRGTIAMARLGGAPDSASNQFFINVVDNDFLDQPQPDGAAYAVFGRILSGMEAVDAIRKVRTGNRGGMGDVPVEPVLITSAKRMAATDQG